MSPTTWIRNPTASADGLRKLMVSNNAGAPTLRMLQVPELRRAMGLQGLRLDHGTRRDKIKLLGNGVCAPVIEAVVRSLTSEPKSAARPYMMAAE